MADHHKSKGWNLIFSTAAIMIGNTPVDDIEQSQEVYDKMSNDTPLDPNHA